jgi:hypothetical protein
MHKISGEYSNILKSTKTLKEQRKTQQTPCNEKRCATNAKISEKFARKTQHDMMNH